MALDHSSTVVFILNSYFNNGLLLPVLCPQSSHISSSYKIPSLCCSLRFSISQTLYSCCPFYFLMREGNWRSTPVHSQPYVLIFNRGVQLYQQYTHACKKQQCAGESRCRWRMLIELVHGSVSLPVFPAQMCADTFWLSRYHHCWKALLLPTVRQLGYSIWPYCKPAKNLRALQWGSFGRRWVTSYFLLAVLLQIRMCCWRPQYISAIRSSWV